MLQRRSLLALTAILSGVACTAPVDLSATPDITPVVVVDTGADADTDADGDTDTDPWVADTDADTDIAVDTDPDPDPDTGGGGTGLRLGLCDAWNAPVLDAMSVAALDGDAADAAALGLTLVRPHRPRGHAFAFNLNEPAGATADWSVTDGIVTAAQDAGVDLLVTLYPYTDPESPTSSPNGVVGVMVPQDLEGYRIWVTHVVERYDGDGVDDMAGLTRRVASWEMANEPSCRPTDHACHQVFLDLVIITWNQIKDADPTAFVIAGASAPIYNDRGGINLSAEALYDWFIAKGGLVFTDAINVHVNTGQASPPASAYVAWWLARTGPKDIWVTESGTRAPGDTKRVEGTEAGEAAWLVEELDDAYASGVSTVLWCKTGDIERFPLVTAALANYAAGL